MIATVPHKPSFLANQRVERRHYYRLGLQRLGVVVDEALVVVVDVTAITMIIALVWLCMFL